ncbi:ROK family protein [Effusibacillus dendaii]|uniref:ROK family protein n=1 Tax=Effusibacillus dendaii TaxID=2743772 RepID=A0A7I8D9L9_9BACL|nr:ROK family protein [Effusibacillus dendaii]BCJ85679.1 hypothetical protein skT53_06640 [Effusibacillus dendaii]
MTSRGEMESNRSYAVGVDVGGTKIAIGIVNDSGSVKEQMILQTNKEKDPNKMIGYMAQSIQKLLDTARVSVEQLAGIGIGAPGPLDVKTGVISCPPNLPSWVDVPVVEAFKRKFSVPIVLDNDANAAALAEKRYGEAQENESFVYLTISTGIGAGLYLDGKLVSGSRGNASDIGHTVIDPSYGTCTCGPKGCFEWIASGTAIARRASELRGPPPYNQTSLCFVQCRRCQDCAICGTSVYIYRSWMCHTHQSVWSGEIVIGGGVSEVGDPLFLPYRIMPTAFGRKFVCS